MAQQGTGTPDRFRTRHRHNRPRPPPMARTGSPCPVFPASPATTGAYQQQLSPAAQEEQQLAAKDRELAYDSRFASNLVYTRAPDQPSRKPPLLPWQIVQAQPARNRHRRDSISDQTGSASSLITPRTAGDPPAAFVQRRTQQLAAQRKPEVNIDPATGQPYVIYEGTTLDAVLMNRLDGDAAGPVRYSCPIPSIRMTASTCWSRREPLCWEKHARSAQRDSASSGAWPSCFTG